MDANEMIVINLIVNSGSARSSAIEAIQYAKAGDMEKAAELGSDMAHWLGLSANERKNDLNANIPEKEITQEMRQEGYDNWTTTDDHCMLIYGVAKDQNGKEYYMVKNSWGKSGKYEGIWYVSKAFVKYKTMNILIHKDAVPTAIKNKLK